MVKRTDKDTFILNDGTPMPRLGQGTWYMGEDKKERDREIEAIRTGIENGMTLIDTAEMYGEGRSEELVGEAIRGLDRESLFIVSKVYPYNAGRPEIFRSCEASLKRLGTDYLDLYLLHWRGSVPLEETVECMNELVAEGKIRNWGVSNFDADDMEELLSIPGGENCRVNQVLYHLGSRGIEYDLLPMMADEGIAVMAYSPMAHSERSRNRLTSHPVVREVAESYGVTPEQLLLAFVLSKKHVIAIPKSGTPEHVKENAEAVSIELYSEDLERLMEAFPAPNHRTPLDML
ncbi:MAG TPA: aldo/keto reductase [Clostridiaceae bacterium]|nr:aldo/keto reductase [Clostridiaceae bacterium]